MSDIAIKVENLSKQYRLGVVGTGTLSHDLNRWWHQLRGKEDPYLKIGETNDRATKGESEYVWALKDINFEVKQGEVLGIIGKNGAGKSTLLKLLSRVTTPTTGEIKAKGRIASLLEVGTGFHPELTGRDNVFLNGAILGMTKAEIKAKFEEIVDFSGTARYIDTPVKRYSSGMRVRLAFAVAAFLEPEILIVDEVLAVGDAEFQKKAIGKMQDVAKGEGRTVLFVSHNMAAVKNLCTRGLLLLNGSTKKMGNVNDIVDLYLGLGDDKNEIEINAESYNSLAFISKIHFENDNNEGKVCFNSEEQINVILDLKVLKDFQDLIIAAQLKTYEEVLIFSSYDSDSLINLGYHEKIGIKKEGMHKVKFSIPPKILNNGNYKLNFILFQPNKSIIQEVEGLGFEVNNIGSFQTKVLFKRKGILSIPCDWVIS